MEPGLPLQLAVMLLLTTVVVAIHVVGTGAMLFVIRANAHHIRPRRNWFEQLLTVMLLVMGLLALHALEILIFAFAYHAMDVFGSFGEALYFSISSYATVGYGDVLLTDWRLVGAWEALVGFILIGWSTALFISVILRVWTKNHSWFDPDG